MLLALRGLGDLLVTGPTLTNVNDFRAILITK
jgi:glycerate-2-kinase